MQEIYITKTNVLGRKGWTQTIIDKFLPKHDKESTNPFSRKAPPVKLYLQSRVEQIENSNEFKVSLEKTLMRKESAAKAVKTKIAKIKQYISTVVIEVPFLGEKELTEKACVHYDERNEFNPQIYGRAADSNDIEFLNRITRNYLRHMLTRYDVELGEIAGKTGNEEAYQLLREKVNKAIEEKYPWLYSN